MGKGRGRRGVKKQWRRRIVNQRQTISSKQLQSPSIIEAISDGVVFDSDPIQFLSSDAFANGNVGILYQKDLQDISSVWLVLLNQDNQIIKKFQCDADRKATALLRQPMISINGNTALISWSRFYQDNSNKLYRVNGYIIDSSATILTDRRPSNLAEVSFLLSEKKSYAANLLPNGKVMVFYPDLGNHMYCRLLDSHLAFNSQFNTGFIYNYDHPPIVTSFNTVVNLFYTAYISQVTSLYQQQYDLNGNKIQGSSASGNLRVTFDSNQLANYAPAKLADDGSVALVWQEQDQLKLQTFGLTANPISDVVNIASGGFLSLSSVFVFNHQKQLLVLCAASDGDQYGIVFDGGVSAVIGLPFQTGSNITALIDRSGGNVVEITADMTVRNVVVDVDRLLASNTPDPTPTATSSPSPRPSETVTTSPSRLGLSVSSTPTFIQYLSPSPTSSLPFLLPSTLPDSNDNRDAIIGGISAGSAILFLLVVACCFRYGRRFFSSLLILRLFSNLKDRVNDRQYGEMEDDDVEMGSLIVQEKTDGNGYSRLTEESEVDVATTSVGDRVSPSEMRVNRGFDEYHKIIIIKLLEITDSILDFYYKYQEELLQKANLERALVAELISKIDNLKITEAEVENLILFNISEDDDGVEKAESQILNDLSAMVGDEYEVSGVDLVVDETLDQIIPWPDLADFGNQATVLVEGLSNQRKVVKQLTDIALFNQLLEECIEELSNREPFVRLEEFPLGSVKKCQAIMERLFKIHDIITESEDYSTQKIADSLKEILDILIHDVMMEEGKDYPIQEIADNLKAILDMLQIEQDTPETQKDAKGIYIADITTIKGVDENGKAITAEEVILEILKLDALKKRGHRKVGNASAKELLDLFNQLLWGRNMESMITIMYSISEQLFGEHGEEITDSDSLFKRLLEFRKKILLEPKLDQDHLLQQETTTTKSSSEVFGSDVARCEVTGDVKVLKEVVDDMLKEISNSLDEVKLLIPIESSLISQQRSEIEEKIKELELKYKDKLKEEGSDEKKIIDLYNERLNQFRSSSCEMLTVVAVLSIASYLSQIQSRIRTNCFKMPLVISGISQISELLGYEFAQSSDEESSSVSTRLSSDEELKVKLLEFKRDLSIKLPQFVASVKKTTEEINALGMKLRLDTVTVQDSSEVAVEETSSSPARRKSLFSIRSKQQDVASDQAEEDRKRLKDIIERQIKMVDDLLKMIESYIPADEDKIEMGQKISSSGASKLAKLYKKRLEQFPIKDTARGKTFSIYQVYKLRENLVKIRDGVIEERHAPAMVIDNIDSISLILRNRKAFFLKIRDEKGLADKLMELDQILSRKLSKFASDVEETNRNILEVAIGYKSSSSTIPGSVLGSDSPSDDLSEDEAPQLVPVEQKLPSDKSSSADLIDKNSIKELIELIVENLNDNLKRMNFDMDDNQGIEFIREEFGLIIEEIDKDHWQSRAVVKHANKILRRIHGIHYHKIRDANNLYSSFKELFLREEVREESDHDSDRFSTGTIGGEELDQQSEEEAIQEAEDVSLVDSDSLKAVIDNLARINAIIDRKLSEVKDQIPIERPRRFVAKARTLERTKLKAIIDQAKAITSIDEGGDLKRRSSFVSSDRLKLYDQQLVGSYKELSELSLKRLNQIGSTKVDVEAKNKGLSVVKLHQVKDCLDKIDKLKPRQIIKRLAKISQILQIELKIDFENYQTTCKLLEEFIRSFETRLDKFNEDVKSIAHLIKEVSKLVEGKTPSSVPARLSAASFILPSGSAQQKK